MKIQSYGAGVQSVALLHMALNGDFERPDLVIFADTQAEPESVYEVLERDKELCEKAGIELAVVSLGNLSATGQWGGLFIPAHTYNERTESKGMLRRQCTQRFKVAPIRRELRRRGVKQAEMWLGISTDEVTRAKPSNVKWLTHRWPLLELGVSRADCHSYLAEIGIEAAKSACVFCPYHSDHEWLRIKQNPRDWRAAVEYDRVIRDTRPEGGKVYVHPQRVPLEMVEFENPDLQPGLWDSECGGHCGL